MIVVLFVAWAVAMPLGYLTGDVFADRFVKDPDTKTLMPWLCALITPLACILAIVMIVQINATDGED